MRNIMRLGDVASYVNGFPFKPSDWSDMGVPIIRIQDLTGNGYQMNRFDGKYDAKYEVRAGDVLISWSASLGVYVWKLETAVLNQHIFKVRFDKVDVDKDFFVYQVECLLKKAARQAHGATMRHLTKPVFDGLPFYLPPKEEQKRIAVQLNAITRLISLRQRQAEKLDELVKARFVEMFGDPVRNTKQFPLVELQDLYDVSSSKRVYQDEMVLNGIPFLRISDIVEKSSNDKCTPQCFISQEMYDQLSQKGLTPNVGDILVTSRGTLGLCYEVKPGEKFYFQDGMISWLYNRKDCVINTYLLYAFRMPGIRKQIDGSNDGSTVSYLSIARLKRLKIELPPLALQTEFSHFVHEVDREKERIQRSAALLETLKRSLMQQYFG